MLKDNLQNPEMEGYCCKLLVVVVVITSSIEVSSIPLDQFFPFGQSAGDTKLTLMNDDSSLHLDVSRPFTILNRQRNSFYVSYFDSYSEIKKKVCYFYLYHR